ncbi:MAG: hypothetical protein ACRDOB_06875, partial [Streptosporangiaceae bacterium]
PKHTAAGDRVAPAPAYVPAARVMPASAAVPARPVRLRALPPSRVGKPGYLWFWVPPPGGRPWWWWWPRPPRPRW